VTTVRRKNRIRALKGLVAGLPLAGLTLYLLLVGPANGWRCRRGLLDYLRGFPGPPLTPSLPPFLPGNRVTLLVDGDQALPALLTAIRQARHSIHWEVMLFAPDASGERVAEALMEAAQRGVQVRLLLDGEFTRKGDPLDWLLRLGRDDGGRLDRLIARMRTSGVQVLDSYPPTRPPLPGLDPELARDQERLNRQTCLTFNHHDHRKILVVDGEVAFVGGMNVSEAYLYETPEAGWHDLMVRLEGPAVRELDRLFAQRWQISGGDLPDVDDPAPSPSSTPDGPSAVQVLAQSPLRGEILTAYLTAIREAQESIWVENPYVNYDPLLEALMEAARRGVQVTMIVPGRHNDEPLLHWMLQRRYAALLAAGVALYEYPDRMSHGKVMLVDDRWVTVGSFNLNHRSVSHDLEANIAIEDPDFARRVRQTLFEPDRARSRRITAPPPFAWWALILELLVPFT